MSLPILRSMLLTLPLILQFAPQIAEAQSIPPQGTDATLDVATWNIEWFGDASNGPTDDAQQRANVKAIIEQTDIDLWGVQEIADPADFDALLTALGDSYDGVLATESGQLRIGFIYKTAVFSRIVFRHILTEFAEGPNNAFAGRPPLQMEADVTIDDTTLRLTFIVLHMKCCGDEDSYDRRAEASFRLKTNLDFLRARDPIIILGDLNDELTRSIRSGQPSPYENFVRDTDHYLFPSLSIEEARLGTFCGSNTTCNTASTIDHILITDELIPFYEPDSADRLDTLLSGISSYVFSTSDHLPVFARFRFDIGTAVEETTLPEVVTLHPAYPNPFSDRTTLTYTLPQATDVRVEAFDLLGRRVEILADGFRNAGVHRVTFEAGDLSSGWYVIRLSAGHAVHVRPVVRR